MFKDPVDENAVVRYRKETRIPRFWKGDEVEVLEIEGPCVLVSELIKEETDEG